MNRFAVISIILASAAWCIAESKIEFREKTPLEPGAVVPADSVTDGSVLLSVSPKQIRIDEKFVVDLRFINEGGGGYVFNPFFRRGIPKPAIIAVYDIEKNYLGSYLSVRDRSYTGVHPRDWVYLSTDDYVGTKLSLLAGRIPETASPPTSDPVLRPGKYYLQAIVNKGFVNFRSDLDLSEVEPDKVGEALITLYDSYDRSELFRSNAVEIELLPSELKEE